MRDVEYKSRGVPLEEYELTKRDRTWQKTVEDIHRHAHEVVRSQLDKERADPELGRRSDEHRERILKWFGAVKTPDYEIMRVAGTSLLRAHRRDQSPL